MPIKSRVVIMFAFQSVYVGLFLDSGGCVYLMYKFGLHNIQVLPNIMDCFS